MQEIFYILAKTVSLTLEVVSLAMLLRMIISIIGNPPESKLYMIASFITEPFIAPVRGIMYMLNIGQDSPIDIAFFVTSIIIGLLQTLLPII